MNNNNFVNKNFSRSSRSYSASGLFQRSASKHLFGFIERELPDADKVHKVLELGCGTGFLTIGLIRLFPDAQFVVSDLSENMLQICMDVTRPAAECQGTPAYFECYNIADANIEKYYDLIISALAFQWIPDLVGVFGNIREHLLPGGHLIFTTLLQGTFTTLHRVFSDLNIPYPGPRMLTEEELQVQCSSFKSCRIESYKYVEDHKSIMDFLKQIQRTGAGNASGHKIAITDMRRIIKHYRELEGDGPIKVEYQLAEVICS